MPRETTVRRVEWYLGPDKEITPADLDKLDAAGCWLIQPKMDGMWCMLEVRNPREGRPHFMKSRDARTPQVSGQSAGDLQEMDIPLPEGTVLVGELESASQWATDQSNRLGYKRLHLFDMPRLGDQDLRDTPTLQRYISLVQETARFGNDAKLSSRFPVVPCVGSEFRKYYDEWVAKGFEGCVAKTRESKYRTSRTDGKTAEWMKVKTVATEDYVLISTTLTPGGKSNRPSVTGVWGLHVDGKLKPVLQCPCPKELLIPENFGKLVAEFKGALKFKSGALRHSGFVRVRTDKSPEDCVLR